MDAIERVGVVGCGLMGSGIAEVAARNGLDVLVAEATPELLANGEERVRKSFSRALKAGKIDQESHDAALARMRFVDDLAPFADRQLVIEAVAEREDVKVGVLSRLDGIVGADAILASNTSSIPIIRLARASAHPGRVIGMHFFNPVPVLPLVELVVALTTDDAVVSAVERFAGEQLHKVTIRAGDRSGFVVNALLVPYLLSAIRMYEAGFASAEDIDTGMEKGCAHPMGPLRLCDLIGLDTLVMVADTMYAETKEPLHAAPALLQRMVDAGWLGRKSGRGFYRYDQG